MNLYPVDIRKKKPDGRVCIRAKSLREANEQGGWMMITTPEEAFYCSVSRWKGRDSTEFRKKYNYKTPLVMICNDPALIAKESQDGKTI